MATTPEATHSPRELFIIGGHLALDFANTVDDPDGPNRHDHAGTYPELVAWSAPNGILRSDQAEALLTEAEDHPRQVLLRSNERTYRRAADLNRFRSAIRPHFIRREGDC